MALTIEQMRHVAKLARLALSDEKLHQLMGHINALMRHFERLQALPTDEVEPTSHSIPVYNAFRGGCAGHAVAARGGTGKCPASTRWSFYCAAHRGGVDGAAGTEPVGVERAAAPTRDFRRGADRIGAGADRAAGAAPSRLYHPYAGAGTGAGTPSAGTARCRGMEPAAGHSRGDKG
jgi:aspartyl/glutamyl-tRNA(Asn/Gln) amidotransferase C subunit